MTLPEKFVDRVLREMGEAEGRALCAALDTAPSIAVRLNTAKCDPTAPCAAVEGRVGIPNALPDCDAAQPAVSGYGKGSGAVNAVSRAAVGGENLAPNAVPGYGKSGDAVNAASRAAVGGENLAPNAVPDYGKGVGAEHAASYAAADGENPAAVSADCGAAANAMPGSDGASLPGGRALSVLSRAAGRVPWCPDGYYLARRPQFTLDSDFHAGAYYVQEAASQFVGYLLGERAAGKRILDLCAAPGGKTTLYASLAGPGGLVVANEIDRCRAQVLADNVRKWGTGNIAVTTCEARMLGDFEAWFDVVEVDAPCSGEGMFRKDEQARAEWSEGNVKLCAARQDELLLQAWRSLKPGGMLIYSTCTFNRDEDEGTLERMLAWAGDEVAPPDTDAVPEAWGIVCGRVGAFATYRFYPHRTCGEGFFAAVARKAPDAGGRCRTPRARRTVFSAVDKASVAELRRWVRSPEKMCFAAVGDTCYGYYVAQAEAVKTLSEALPVIYAGVAMGRIFKGRLKPDPALAFFCGLDPKAVPAAELDEEQALRYLRRQEVSAEPFREGVNLVCARGRALGFAKRIGGRVNNMYPNSLRILKQ